LWPSYYPLGIPHAVTPLKSRHIRVYTAWGIQGGRRRPQAALPPGAPPQKRPFQVGPPAGLRRVDPGETFHTGLISIELHTTATHLKDGLQVPIIVVDMKNTRLIQKSEDEVEKIRDEWHD
jgi:hypothetical protein